MCAVVIFFFDPQSNSMGSNILIPILQMESPRHREVNKLAQDHIVAGCPVNTCVVLPLIAKWFSFLSSSFHLSTVHFLM